jgi:Ca-activated chloride channel family protein
MVEPTTDKRALVDAIFGLRTYRGTAIGLGILASLDAIADVNPDVPHTGTIDAGDTSPAAGDFQPDTIVVLTDGANTQGVDPVTAAYEAAARGVRVYTIGFGTTDPSSMVCSADQLGDVPFGFGGGGFDGSGGFGAGGFGGRNGRFLQLDEESLTQVAQLTGGEYFQAQDAQALTDVLLDLPSHVVLAERQVELTVWFALAGALLLTAGAGLSLWWQHHPLGARP